MGDFSNNVKGFFKTIGEDIVAGFSGRPVTEGNLLGRRVTATSAEELLQNYKEYKGAIQEELKKCNWRGTALDVAIVFSFCSMIFFAATTGLLAAACPPLIALTGTGLALSVTALVMSIVGLGKLTIKEYNLKHKSSELQQSITSLEKEGVRNKFNELLTENPDYQQIIDDDTLLKLAIAMDQYAEIKAEFDNLNGTENPETEIEQRARTAKLDALALRADAKKQEIDQLKSQLDQKIQSLNRPE